MKLKGLTKQQSEALLWCAEKWRAVRTNSNGPFKSLGLRPYIEWAVSERRSGDFKYIKVRLTPEGMARLIDAGVIRFPHVALNEKFSPVEWLYFEESEA
jgi:hypothetical protein